MALPVTDKRMSKRLQPDVYRSRKKIYLPSTSTWSLVKSPEKKDSTKDTKQILDFLHSIFPIEKFDFRIPQIIFKHQLYSISNNKTETDRQLQQLRNKDEIRYFHLGVGDEDIAIVFTNDYEKHLKKFNKDNKVIDTFFDLLKQCHDVFLTRDVLSKFQMGDDEICELFKAGILTTRNLGTWWISIPGAGEFIKCFLQGRKMLLQIIRKSKYGEALENELLSRKLPKTAKLGMNYHLHDVVGAELVECVRTSSGRLIRDKD